MTSNLWHSFLENDLWNIHCAGGSLFIISLIVFPLDGIMFILSPVNFWVTFFLFSVSFGYFYGCLPIWPLDTLEFANVNSIIGPSMSNQHPFFHHAQL